MAHIEHLASASVGNSHTFGQRSEDREAYSMAVGFAEVV